MKFKDKLTEFFKLIPSRFNKVADYLYKHKVIVIIIVCFLMISTVVFVVANHYLNKINYVQATMPTILSTQDNLVSLGNGETVDLDEAKMNADGSYTLSDGRIYRKDGSVLNPDGSIIFKDGSYITADKIAVLSDGTTIYLDGTIVFQDGSVIENSGIKVDDKGYATFKNGEKAHISTFLINKDGQISSKTENNTTPSKVTTTSAVNATEDNGDNDDAIIQSAKNENTSIKDKLENNDKVIEENFNNSEIWYNDRITNILLMGIDNGSKSFPNGRSDSMIVVSINRDTKAVKLISFSRAVYVKIQGYDNTRLSHAHGYGGAALAIDTIQKNYKIRIDNYIETNFEMFQKLINAIGGVKIDLTAAEAKALKSKLVKSGQTYVGAGTYVLNGEVALNYVRLRKIDTDRQRTQRQRNVLTAIANQAMNMNVFQLNSMLNEVLPYITTDLSKTEIIGQLTNVTSYLSNPFEQYVVPHKSSSLTMIDNFEVLLVDWEDEVKYVHELFYKGYTPSYMAS